MASSLYQSEIPWPRKLGYGSAELGIVAVEVTVELYLLKFYNVQVGLAPGYTALALALALVWDAVSDPIMGEISDRTRRPQGRRRPFLIPGALGLAVAVAVMYNPPAFDSALFQFGFLLASYLLLTTAMTVISVPHIALGGELSFDRDERTQIFGYRRLFTTLGLVLGTILPAVILSWMGGDADPDEVARSRGLAALLLAGPILLSAWISYTSTRGLDSVESEAEHARRRPLGVSELLRAQLSVLRNPVFLPLLVAFLVAGVGRALNASTALYYYEYRLGIPETVTVLRVLLPFFASIILSIPAWIWLSRRFGKKPMAFAGAFGLGVLVVFGYGWMPPEQLTGPLMIALFGGFLAGSLILMESMVADAVDYDELHLRRNREGLYFGVWKMGVKLSRALGLILAGIWLTAIGFDEGALIQSDSVKHGLAMLFGPGVGGLFILGSLFVLRMPMNDARHRRVQALLQRRHARGEGAVL